MNVMGSVSQLKRLMIQFLLNSAGDCLDLECSAIIHVLKARSRGFDVPERMGILGGETQKEEARPFECALEELWYFLLPLAVSWLLGGT